MAGFAPKSADKSSAYLDGIMSAESIEYRDLLAQIAGPQRLGDNLKAALARIARKTGLTDRRVRSIWHGEVKDIRARELAALLKAARERKALEEATHEYRTLDARLTAIEAALGIASADLARSEGDAVRPMGGPLDQG